MPLSRSISRSAGTARSCGRGWRSSPGSRRDQHAAVLSLLILVLKADDEGRLSGGLLGPEGLPQPALVVAHHCRGHVEYRLGGPGSLLEPHDFGPRKHLGEREDVANLGAAAAFFFLAEKSACPAARALFESVAECCAVTQRRRFLRVESPVLLEPSPDFFIASSNRLMASPFYLPVSENSRLADYRGTCCSRHRYQLP